MIADKYVPHADLCFQCRKPAEFKCLACSEQVCQKHTEEHGMVEDDGKVTCPQDREESP